jgi:uncharacterized protein
MKNPICHVEIPADDVQKLVGFYQDLFSWEFKTAPGFPDYHVAGEGGKDVTVAIMARQAPEHCAMQYALVESVDDMVARATSLGAILIMPKTPVAGHGWFAVLLDPQRNAFGFWQTDENAA